MCRVCLSKWRGYCEIEVPVGLCNGQIVGQEESINIAGRIVFNAGIKDFIDTEAEA
jgi:hypothetical protein